MPIVEIPLFEMAGPPCETEGCTGVLIDSVDLKTKDYLQRCWVCKGEFNRVSAKEKLDWAVRTIDAALKGEKIS